MERITGTSTGSSAEVTEEEEELSGPAAGELEDLFADIVGGGTGEQSVM